CARSPYGNAFAYW
nr:immunoglobulin heavy chain junction region [Mus musculus]